MEKVDNLNKEFINLVLDIEKRFSRLTKHDRLKVESWVKVLCIPTNNIEWKKNRNLHTIMLLDNIINQRLEDPYCRFPEDFSSVPLLSRIEVKAKISSKFNKEVIDNIESDRNISELVKGYDHLEKLKKSKLLFRSKVKQMRVTPSRKRVKSVEDPLPRTRRTLPLNFDYSKETKNLKTYLNSLLEEDKSKEKVIEKLNKENNSLRKKMRELEKLIEDGISKNVISTSALKAINNSINK